MCMIGVSFYGYLSRVFCIFVATITLGLIMQIIFNLIKKPYHHMSCSSGKAYAVSVFTYSRGRSASGHWTQYDFLRKNKHWKYVVDKKKIQLMIIITAIMIFAAIVIGVVNGYNLYTIISITVYVVDVLAGCIIVGPLDAYLYVRKYIK